MRTKKGAKINQGVTQSGQSSRFGSEEFKSSNLFTLTKIFEEIGDVR